MHDICLVVGSPAVHIPEDPLVASLTEPVPANVRSAIKPNEVSEGDTYCFRGATLLATTDDDKICICATLDINDFVTTTHRDYMLHRLWKQYKQYVDLFQHFVIQLIALAYGPWSPKP